VFCGSVDAECAAGCDFERVDDVIVAAWWPSWSLLRGIIIASRFPGAETGMSDKPTILVVDDCAEVLLATERVLGRLDARLLTAKCGQEAVDLASSCKFAVALLDVQMPGMDGFETAALIRGTLLNEQTPIVFVTANQEEDFEFRGYDAGAVDYLIKPVRPRILKSKVRVFLDLDRKRSAIERLSAELADRVSTLQRTQRKLLESEQLAAFGVLAGSIAEELAEPLEELTENLQRSIAEASDCDDSVGRSLDEALASSRRCAEVVRDLLLFSGGDSAGPESGPAINLRRRILN